MIVPRKSKVRILGFWCDNIWPTGKIFTPMHWLQKMVQKISWKSGLLNGFVCDFMPQLNNVCRSNTLKSCSCFFGEGSKFKNLYNTLKVIKHDFIHKILYWQSIKRQISTPNESTLISLIKNPFLRTLVIIFRLYSSSNRWISTFCLKLAFNGNGWCWTFKNENEILWHFRVLLCIFTFWNATCIKRVSHIIIVKSIGWFKDLYWILLLKQERQESRVLLARSIFKPIRLYFMLLHNVSLFLIQIKYLQSTIISDLFSSATKLVNPRGFLIFRSARGSNYGL